MSALMDIQREIADLVNADEGIAAMGAHAWPFDAGDVWAEENGGIRPEPWMTCPWGPLSGAPKGWSWRNIQNLNQGTLSGKCKECDFTSICINNRFCNTVLFIRIQI